MRVVRSFPLGSAQLDPRWARVEMTRDGSKVVASWMEGPTRHVVVNGRPLGHGDTVELDRRGWEKVGSFDLVTTIKGFSPDGRRFGFGFEEGKRHGFWIDGVRHDGFLYTDGPYWSADGRHVAWGARTSNGPSCVFVDGVMHPLEAEIVWEEGSEFTFAPDGRFCLVLLDRKRDVNLIRVGGASYEVGRPRYGGRAEPGSPPCVIFSRDGSRFALGGSFGAPSGD